MIGRQSGDQGQFYYAFKLDERVPETHPLRQIDIFVKLALASFYWEMTAFRSHTGRPSIDPELLLRMQSSATAMASGPNASCARPSR